MKLSFKKRIAFLNTLAVALILAFVFVIIFWVVYYSSYRHLDNDIITEKEEVFNNLDWKGDSIIRNKMPEWEEAEHKQTEVNPTFIQIVDMNDMSIFKSANLKNDHFSFNPTIEATTFYNTILNNQRIRIGQFPIYNESKKIIGHLTVGVSQQESYNVLHNLMLVLIITYFFTIGLLYRIMSFVASKAIAPVHQLIKSAAGITDKNINERLPLPENEDELYQLATTINELLNRLSYSMQQQKQFAADASHEMRTPLAALKGTLEVLLRKERSAEQYEIKLKELMLQTDRLSLLFDQLLQLARVESDSTLAKKEMIPLADLVENILTEQVKLFPEKQMSLQVHIPIHVKILADSNLLDRILENLLNNAFKYSPTGATIEIEWKEKESTLSIQNEGAGIPASQIHNVFNRFYRTDESRSSLTPGNGLGLAIVKKLCELQKIGITVNSIEGQQTTFSLHFPS